MSDTPMTREQAWETLDEAKNDYALGMASQGYREGTMKRLLDDYDEARRFLRTEMERLEGERDEWENAYNDLLAQIGGVSPG